MKIISFIPPFLSSSKLKKRSAKKERRSVSRSDNSSFASTTSTSSEDISSTPRSILSRTRTITGRELEGVLRHLGSDCPTEAEVLATLSEAGIAVSRSGRIAIAELTALGVPRDREEMRETFAAFDVNGDGKISAEELMTIFAKLGEECSIEECRRMIGEVDSDGDGFVCFDDFTRMMNGQRW